MAQLQDIFQRHAVVKILDFLTLYKDFEYTRTDIANETGISRRTLYQVWPILEEFELVEVTKSLGQIKFYKLNIKNPISEQLVVLADKISLFRAHKLVGIESIPLIRVMPESASTSVSTIQPPVMEVSYQKMEVKGTVSQIKEIIQKISELEDGQVKIAISTSTGLGDYATQKKRRQLIASIAKTDGT